MQTTSSDQIRRLRQADMGALLDLIRDSPHECALRIQPEPGSDRCFATIFNPFRHKRSMYSVAVVNGDVVGGAGIIPRTEDEWSACELVNLVLRPQYRGRGLGTALVESCRHTARSLGFQRCYTKMHSETAMLMAFYERNGYRRLCAPVTGDAPRESGDWLVLELGYPRNLLI